MFIGLRNGIPSIPLQQAVAGDPYEQNFDTPASVAEYTAVNGADISHNAVDNALQITGDGVAVFPAADGPSAGIGDALNTPIGDLIIGQQYRMTIVTHRTGDDPSVLFSISVGQSMGGAEYLADIRSESGEVTFQVVFTAATARAYVRFQVRGIPAPLGEEYQLRRIFLERI